MAPDAATLDRMDSKYEEASPSAVMAATISRGNLRPSSRCVMRLAWGRRSACRVRESACLSSMVGVRPLWGLLARGLQQ